MKKNILIAILLIGVSAYLGYFFGNKNANTKDGLKTFLTNYLKSDKKFKPLWETVDPSTANKMFDNYNKNHKSIVLTEMRKKEGFKDFKGDSTGTTDVNSILYFAAKAYVLGIDSVNFSFAQHDQTTYPKKEHYNGYLTFIVSAIKNQKRVKLFDETTEYYDLMTLCPPDCK